MIVDGNDVVDRGRHAIWDRIGKIAQVREISKAGDGYGKDA
jgi:hypothetical protein